MAEATKKGGNTKQSPKTVERRDVDTGARSAPEKKRAKAVPFYADADTPFEQVVAADRAGNRVIFDPDFFPTYTEAQQEALSDVTRAVYESVEELVVGRGQQEIDEEEVLQRLHAEGAHDYATARFEVHDKNPEYDYIWPYPDDVQRLRESGYWEVVSGTGEWTAGNPDGSRGMHMIGKQGAREHILMRRKKSISKMFVQKREEQFAKAAGLVETEFREGMEREGVPTFNKDDAIARRAQFTDTAVGRVREG